MRVLKPVLFLIALAIAALLWNRQGTAPPPDAGTAMPHATLPASNNALPPFLPPEAADLLARIAHGGPFEHRQDGIVFNNREGRLPAMPEGYYHEYTVDTPGLDYRGARRIITGGTPAHVYYYTDDHYRTFRQFEVSR